MALQQDSLSSVVLRLVLCSRPLLSRPHPLSSNSLKFIMHSDYLICTMGRDVSW